MLNRTRLDIQDRDVLQFTYLFFRVSQSFGVICIRVKRLTCSTPLLRVITYYVETYTALCIQVLGRHIGIPEQLFCRPTAACNHHLCRKMSSDGPMIRNCDSNLHVLHLYLVCVVKTVATAAL